MSYLLFLDESGVDRRQSPYEVLAGIAVHEQQLWRLIVDIQDLEVEIFGDRITPGPLELKGKKLIKRKTFRLADSHPTISPPTRAELAQRCLEKGRQKQPASRTDLAALAQAKIAFVEAILNKCAELRLRAFASIASRSAPRPEGSFLRKDYAYLFEHFFYFLETVSPSEQGIVIFDELERSQCHVLVDQMHLYFRDTATGRSRAHRVIPEPFFVHSELTTAIQLADLVAYIVCWGVRFGSMRAPKRNELASLAEQVCRLRYRTERNVGGVEGREIWSFSLIRDLRPRDERRPE